MLKDLLYENGQMKGVVGRITLFQETTHKGKRAVLARIRWGEGDERSTNILFLETDNAYSQYKRFKSIEEKVTPGTPILVFGRETESGCIQVFRYALWSGKITHQDLKGALLLGKVSGEMDVSTERSKLKTNIGLYHGSSPKGFWNISFHGLFALTAYGRYKKTEAGVYAPEEGEEQIETRGDQTISKQRMEGAKFVPI